MSTRPPTITGVSSAVVRIREALPDIAASALPVLILGPPGSGREHLARAIHALADNTQDHFTRLDCRMLPASLIETRLAAPQLPLDGDTTAATLFLAHADDGNEPLATVVRNAFAAAATPSRNRLRRLIVGAAPSCALAADNSVIRIELPPLAARRIDIPPLVNALLDDLRAAGSCNAPRVTPETMDILATHDYAGNTRDLRDILGQAARRSGNAPIQPSHLPPGVQAGAAATPPSPGAAIDPFRILRASNPLREAEAQVILMFLNHNNGNRSRTAAALHLHPSTLYRKMQRHDIR